MALRRFCIRLIKVSKGVKNSMIVGYYGAAFFGGAKYIKVYDYEGETFLEGIGSGIPNLIRGASENLREGTLIQEREGLSHYQREGAKIIRKAIPVAEKTRIEEYIKAVNWDYLSEQEYTAKCFDSLCWEVFIDYDGNANSVSGYHVVPDEVKGLVRLLEELLNDEQTR